MHCKYVQDTKVEHIDGANNIMKQVKLKYEDGRKPDGKYVNTLSELRSTRVQIPKTGNPEEKVLVPLV